MNFALAGLCTVGVFNVSPVQAETEIQTFNVKMESIHAIENGTSTTIDVDFVTNPNNGPTLGLLHERDQNGDNPYILSVTEGSYTYAFKDMNRNGELDAYDDWRLSTDERVHDLATSLVEETDDAGNKTGIKKIAGLMLFSSHEGNSAQGLTENQKTYLTDSYVRNITDSADNNVDNAVGWTNMMQAFVEESDFNVPVDFSSDPRSTAGSGDLYSSAAENSDISAWPSNLGMAATFSEDHMYNFAKATSEEYRALGIVTALGPQIDLATDPRWLRNGGTFGEDTKLATTMAQAYVDGTQSTYAADGNDLGWGLSSVNAMIKHFPGDGAGEGGRESHTTAGKYAVYPGNNFDEHVIPFVEGGLQLKGKTESAAAIMTSYSIGVNADGTALGGQYVGSAYSAFKMELLRMTLGYDGVVCTDWGVTSYGGFGMAYGYEDATTQERHYAILNAGTDMFGGNNDASPIVDSYEKMVQKDGEEVANARFVQSAERLLKLTMNPGLFENPYQKLADAKAIAGSKDKVEAGYQAQLDSIVMVKNVDNTIQEASKMEKDSKDMTVYIPTVYTEEQPSIWSTTPASWAPSMNLEVAKSVYGTVITDTKIDEDTYEVPDLSNVDKVIVGMRSPMNGGLFSGVGQYTDDDGNVKYYPLSLQYSTYTADGDNVRKTSITGDVLADGTKENRSYYGGTSRLINEGDLDGVLKAVAAVEATNKDIPIVVSMNASGPAIMAEFEDKVDAIVVGFSVSDKAIYDVVEGNHEPKGLLPMQFPANMDTVEANYEDIAFDLDCYVDSQGNTYDFAYGLNWSGIIDDARVKEYVHNNNEVVRELQLTASDFALTNAEAKTIDAKGILEKAQATASWNIETKANDAITLIVTDESMKALQAVDAKGATVDVVIQATSDSQTKQVTVKATVAKEDVKSNASTGTNTNGTVDTSDRTNQGMLVALCGGAMLIVLRKMYQRKANKA
ncbi:cell wall anchor protein [Erysipelotrichaceae bacterium MTC7]|nr:cell wall anchor protein [Erysipelotrichaceae bacterium MTC7]